MNPDIEKLHRIANKDSRLIIGLMSGTSLDGLDIALCEIRGTGHQTHLQLKAFITQPYTPKFTNRIKQVFSKQSIDQQLLCGLNAQVAQVHADLVLDALDQWDLKPEDIDLIASHGQTVYHAPQSLTKNLELPNSTLQIGDGDHLAVQTGIITIADFRQKHVASGGQGAPLALYGDFLLFSDTEEDRVLLNIGGISNFSFIPSRKSNMQAFATDLGPGNTLMNQYMSVHFGLDMDRDASLASQGQINQKLLQLLLTEPFLVLPLPKTTGPELFSYDQLQRQLQVARLQNLTHADIMATLNRFTAQTIIDGLSILEKETPDFKLYISGGGLHNPLLMNQLESHFGLALKPLSVLKMDPDAKEACLFALLANQTVSGHPDDFQHLDGAPAVNMGKICFPY